MPYLLFSRKENIMEVLLYAYIFFTGLPVLLACISTDNSSPMFDIGLAVGLFVTICSCIMMISTSISYVFDCISLLLQ